MTKPDNSPEFKATTPAASSALLQEGPFFEAITELLPVCLFAKDLEGRYIYVNDAFVRTTSQTDKGAILGKKAVDIFSPEHAKLAEKEDNHILETGESIINRENLNEDWYHEANYVIVSKICVRAKDGRKLGIAGITIDITQRKNDEIRLGELNDELEQRNDQLEEELSLAREVQKTFVRVQTYDPADQLEVGSCYQPSEKLSGDLIVFEPVSETHWALLCCDVMGHGMRSALITGIIRGFYNEQKYMHEDPDRFVYKLNQHYCSVLEDLDRTIFTTLTYGLLNPKTGQMRLTCAGHHDPLWFRSASGKFVSPNERVLLPDPAIGLLRQFDYRSTTLSLKTDDLLLFYTDGLTECESLSGEEFGIDPIRQMIADHHKKPGSVIVDNIIRRAHSFAASIEDDLSLLMFRYKG